MNIIRTYVQNSQDNYNHLVYCPNKRLAAAVDPYDAEHLIDLASSQKLSIAQIWITHEHGDHIRDMEKLKVMSQAKIYAPETCKSKFKADYWLKDNQTISLGEQEIRHLLAPGHTPGHGIYLHNNADSQKDFVVCADTLFNAGIGNVYSGDVNVLYQTIQRLTTVINDHALLYPGHDYMINNLQFVLHYFPTCTAARDLLATIISQEPDNRQLQTFGAEKQYNPFLNLTASWLISHSEMENLTVKERFVRLREWRNQW